METMLETIDLDLDESNDLKFKIKLEGNVNSPAKVRLVCEGEDVSYVFKGYGTSEMDVVQFTLPRMENKIKEGIYSAKVEVLVENRYFAPLQFQINFKKSVSVVAEAMKVIPKVEDKSIRVTAVPIIEAKKKEVTEKFEKRPAVFERKQPEQEKQSKSASLREAYLSGIRDNKKVEETPEENQGGFKTLREIYLSKKLKKITS